MLESGFSGAAAVTLALSVLGLAAAVAFIIYIWPRRRNGWTLAMMETKVSGCCSPLSFPHRFNRCYSGTP